MNGTTVPTMRDNTYSSDEVSRKTPEELRETAFNDDQNEVLNEITTDIESEIPEIVLPEVTSDDNGDVLMVVEGAWAKAQPSGDDNSYVVTFTVTMQDMYTVESVAADKSFEEVTAAINSGKVVMAKLTGFPANDFFLPLARMDRTRIWFASSIVPNANTVDVKSVNLTSSDDAYYKDAIITVS